MPARKRKAPTKASAPASKKARMGNTSSAVNEPEEAPAPRPRRTTVAEAAAVSQDQEPPKRRGRPRKSEAPAADVGVEKRKRGRPPKVDSTLTVEQNVKKQPVTRPAKAAPKTTQKAAATDNTGAPRKRGRPPKSATPRKRGRPRKDSTAAPLNNADTDDISADDDAAEEQDSDEDDRQYWLMKAEPNDRFEKGVNVKFSIDDLAAASVPEPWDGVRNYAARNNMRAMRKGDLAFFYHSSCPVPAIVGIMRIVQEHTPDQSAFDPNHPYFDDKSSPSSPKWECVHVEFVRKFDSQVTLKTMQENKNATGKLKEMQLLRLARLSVSKVTSEEWKAVLDLAGEEATVGEDGANGVADGYESDTDGEVDKGPKEELNGDIAAAAGRRKDLDTEDEEYNLDDGRELLSGFDMYEPNE